MCRLIRLVVVWLIVANLSDTRGAWALNTLKVVAGRAWLTFTTCIALWGLGWSLVAAGKVFIC